MGRRQEEEERQRGPMWGSPGRRGSSWPAALLAAAVLSSGFLVARAQEIPIAVEPSQPLEGQNVTLTPGGTANIVQCIWFRGGQDEANRIFTYVPTLSPPEKLNGPNFTERETGGPGCSLHIRSLMLNDTGDYIVTKTVSGGPETGRVHIGVLAAVLSSGFLLAQAQETPVSVTVDPSGPLEGQDVTLTPGGNPTFVLCIWYRGEEAEANRIFRYIPTPLPPEQQNGLSFTGRETGGPHCSLHIRSLMFNDTGVYTVSKAVRGGAETGRAYIGVLEKLFPPVLWPAELFVEEHADVTLNCTTSEHSGIAISWFKDGRVVPAKVALSERNQTLTVPDVSRDDEGMYMCEARNWAYSAMSNPSKIAVTQPHSTLAAGAISAIVLGSLAAAALAGTLLYCFFRARRQKNKSSKQMNPTSPVYENTGPSAQVVPVNSSEINHTYEELQHGGQAVYDQLRW